MSDPYLPQTTNYKKEKLARYLARKMKQHMCGQNSGTTAPHPFEALLAGMDKGAQKGYDALNKNHGAEQHVVDPNMFFFTHKLLKSVPGLSVQAAALRKKPCQQDIDAEKSTFRVQLRLTDGSTCELHYDGEHGRLVDRSNQDCLEMELEEVDDGHRPCAALGAFSEYRVIVNGAMCAMGLVQINAPGYKHEEVRAVRVPLYDAKTLASSQSRGLAVTELVLMVRCAHQPVHGPSFKLMSCRLQCLTDSGLKRLSLLGTPDHPCDQHGLSATGMMPFQQLPPRPLALQMPQCPRQRATSQFLQSLMGANVGKFSFSLQGFHGSKHVLDHETGDRKDMLYRMGGASEMLFNIGMVHYLQSALPGMASTRFHDAKMLQHYMKHGGSEELYQAVEDYYRRHRMSVPTINELFNHTAGLPEYVPAPSSALAALLNPPDLEKARVKPRSAIELLVQLFRGNSMTPVAAPGVQYHHSNIGLLLLRSCVPGWTQPNGVEAMLLRTAKDLGAPKCAYSAPPSELAPVCPDMVDPEGQFRRQAERCGSSQKGNFYAVTSALLAVPRQMAALLSDANPWKPCAKKQRESYGFLSGMIKPQVEMDAKEGTFAGYGWTHYQVPLPGRGAGSVPMLSNVGYTPGAHTVVLVSVPTLRLAGVLATNADASRLIDSQGTRNLVPLLARFLELLLQHTDNTPEQPLTSCPLSEQLLADAPRRSVRRAEWERRLSRQEYVHVVPQVDPYMGSMCSQSFFTAPEFFGRGVVSELRVEPVQQTAGTRFRLVMLRGVKLNLEQGTAVHSGRRSWWWLVLDRSVAPSGVYRVIDPNTNLPNEHVAMIFNTTLQQVAIGFKGSLYVSASALGLMRISLGKLYGAKAIGETLIEGRVSYASPPRILGNPQYQTAEQLVRAKSAAYQSAIGFDEQRYLTPPAAYEPTDGSASNRPRDEEEALRNTLPDAYTVGRSLMASHDSAEQQMQWYKTHHSAETMQDHFE
jgi:hypothetical protein